MKTAVEWLIEKLQDNFSKQLQDMYESNQLLFEDVFIKVKEMEKKQNRAAYKRGQRHKKPLKDSNPITKYLK